MDFLVSRPVLLFSIKKIMLSGIPNLRGMQMTMPELFRKLKRVFLYEITRGKSTEKRSSKIRLKFSHRPIDEFQGPNETYKVLRNGWSLFD